MTARELYRIYLQSLVGVYGQEEAATITRIVFESMAGIKPFDFIKEPGQVLEKTAREKLHQALLELEKQKPVQYVTGEAWFYKLPFKVNEAVLIPRPETEELVEAALSFLQGYPNARVLDIGTGSGCIPIAIKKNKPDALVGSIDISADALEVARENAASLQADIIFEELDFLDEANWNKLFMYDLVISNPPYIPISEKKDMETHVTNFEPGLALFVQNEYPLIFYEKLASFAKVHLAGDGQMMMETHENYAEKVCGLMLDNGFTAAIINDMSGKQRMVVVNHSR
jgi:release factor glutamine methyltransferase